MSDFVFYDNIKDMPIDRWNLLQCYTLQDNNIGNDITNISMNFAELFKGIENDFKKEDLRNIINNIILTHYTIFDKINFKSLSFCCFVKSYKGKIIGNKDSDIEKLNKIIGDKGTGFINENLESLKKKLKTK